LRNGSLHQRPFFRIGENPKVHPIDETPSKTPLRYRRFNTFPDRRNLQL
jgi:hypothetical protein